MSNYGFGQLRHQLAVPTAISTLALLLSGCMVGPNYHKPAAPVPPAFQEPTVPPPAGQNAIAYSDWWKVFHDQTLDGLEVQADAANQDIKIAIAHVDEATAATNAVHSFLLPTVGAAPSVSRTREAQNRPNNGNTNGHAATNTDIQLPLFANYELDAWGRIRRSVQSARATQEATVADLRFVRLSAEASVAIDYYQLRETDQELQIVDTTLTDFTRALSLTTDRYKKGLNSELEVEQAKTLLDQTVTQKQALQNQRAQLEHAIAVLLGRTVEGFSLPDQPSNPTPPVIPSGLPSDLLERRPDITEADRNVAAATAQIGVAKAAYFPQLSLTGLVGYESTNAVSLLNWQNTMASLGASAVAPIFTGGRLRAGVDQAQATYRQSLAQYEKTVLVAYQEVEDQLAALRYLGGESQSQASAVHDATRAEEIAMQRYKAGLVGYLDVVFAQETELGDERAAAQISGQQLVASVVLIKALGGGWEGVKTPMMTHRPMSMRLNMLGYITCLGLIGCVRLAAQAPLTSANDSRPVLVSDPTLARSPVLLKAVNDPHTGKGSFWFDGREDAPVIRVKPGEDMRLTYMNAMSTHSREHCVDRPCMNMSNLHFHGLHVSPDAPQDDVITMMAMPGQSLHYTVNIPTDQPPGLYWYHTHPHGESYQQDLDGMSGAIVIEGIERYAPEVQRMRERILVLRDRLVEENDPARPELRRTVEIPSTGCGTSTEAPEHLFTVNGTLRPQIAIAPGERQFWRIVNASPDLYADLQVDGEQLEIVALDGMPLSFHHPKRRVELTSHVLVPPAGRVEAIVTGPGTGARASLRTRCFDTGPDGDPNPAMVLADLVDIAQPAHGLSTTSVRPQAPLYKPVSSTTITRIENSHSDFVVSFTEDKKGFYINRKKYGPSDHPMTSVSIGAFHHWRVVNDTHEVHPFHIHQVHFLAYAENGRRLSQPEWLDTVNVPVEGSVDLMMDFTDPIIRGVSLFHCHLLSHEDKGMMAKILFK